MAAGQDVFRRYEKKYLLDAQQHEWMVHKLQGHMQADVYGLHTICNIYFDTDNYQLIRTSIEKPVYKEKLRMRSYGIPGEQDIVFLELKKKYKGVVYKRRAAMTLTQAQAYLASGQPPGTPEQILHEINWFMQFYHPVPKAYIAYDRIALFDNEFPELRVTFDQNIRGRDTMLDLRKGTWGTPLLPPDTWLMEIKTPGAMPFWLCRLMSEAKIFPASYSKYGTFYTDYLYPVKEYKGGSLHA